LLKETANIVRGLSADGVEKANSGHPGMPIGCAEIGSLLFGEIMDFDPDKPEWVDRDRFVLSAGHGSMLLYSLLHLSGYDLSLEDLKNFRQLGSKTPGHPEYSETPGVETTTGPLGQGIGNGVGMALAEKMMAEKYNTKDEKVIDHYTYVLAGDGCMMEGISSEASSLAGHLELEKLIVIYDDNEISIEGSTDLAFTESVADRYKAYNWHVIEDVDGNDLDELRKSIKKAKQTDKPTLIMAQTSIAKHSPQKEGTSDAHGAPLGEEEIKGLKKNIGLPVDKKFYISEDVKEFFAKRKKELKNKRKKWVETFEKWSNKNPELKKEWDNAAKLELPEDLKKKINDIDIDSPIATRKSSGATLRKLADEVPYLIGGSADLAPSNKTYLSKYGEIQKDNFAGKNIRFGVREHAMGAIANGIAAHGGFRPFAATFLVFTDYMRPAMRLAALMGLPVIYVFTHDSIYIGEDGPTHQPVEHVESLRLIPNLKVIRPADDDETKEAWYEALNRKNGPTALVFTRQNLPHLEKENGINGFEKGGYIVSGSVEDDVDVVLMASGSEVSLAVETAELLTEDDIKCRVVSIPDRTKFAENDQKYINGILGSPDVLRVALEAGVGQGWYQFLGDNHHLVSVEDFGESAPGQQVGEHYGFKAEKIAKDIKDKL